jgi:hypothetical protein
MVVKNNIRSLGAVGFAFVVATAGQVLHLSAQQVAPYQPPAQRVSPADGFARQRKSSVQTPRTADGHPDLTGLWNGGFPSPVGPYAIRHRGTFEPDQAAMQRGSQWNKPLYKPEYWDKVRSLDFSTVEVDPSYRCLPTGVPRQGAPMKIIQKGNEILLNNPESVRFVPLDGRARDPLDQEYSTWSGIPRGHWDGDALVVESVGFNDLSWLQWEGYFHTDKMKVTERLRRDGDLLFYNYTVEDPDVLIEPWNSITYVRKLNANPLARIDEGQPCEERDLDLIADKHFRG